MTTSPVLAAVATPNHDSSHNTLVWLRTVVQLRDASGTHYGITWIDSSGKRQQDTVFVPASELGANDAAKLYHHMTLLDSSSDVNSIIHGATQAFGRDFAPPPIGAGLPIEV